MVGALLLLTGVSMGINTGWQPTAGGEMEYIIQIEPQLLKSLQAGDDLVSEVPIDLRSVRRYRIVVGTGELPRIRPRGDAAAAAAALRREAASSPQPLEPGRGVPRTFADAATTAPGNSVLNQGKLKGGVPAASTAEPAEEPAGPALDTTTLSQNPPAEIEPAAQIAEDNAHSTTIQPELILPPNDKGLDESLAKKAAIAEPATVEFPKLPDRYQSPADFSEPKRMVPVHKPEQFEPDQKAGQLANHSGADKEKAASAKQDIIAVPTPATTATSSDVNQPKPWFPLVVTLLGFVASVGANVYLVWIWLDTRRRYFQLAHAQRAAA